MRKGFTLIEMLGIITVLAVVLLVTFPVMNNALKKMKENTNDGFKKNLKISAEAYVELNKEKNIELKNTGTTTVTVQELYDSNLLKGDQGVDPKTNMIITTAQDGTMNFYYIDPENVTSFGYTGNVQQFTVPKAGLYKIETWGAQGGSFQISSEIFKSGYGAYSGGYINLTENQVLYVVVGRKGDYCESNDKNVQCTSTRSYNGGGECKSLTGYSSQIGIFACGSGGGATHIAINSNLGELRNYNNNRNDILIVSGGGGGAHAANYPFNYGYGGSAGGYIGNNNESKGRDTKIKNGGTQSTGNAFGYGAQISSYCNGGGGGGYYGGEGAIGGSAGGSGYIGNTNLLNKSMYCYDCAETTEASTFTVSTTGDSDLKNIIGCPIGYSEYPVSKCAKAGDGYAKITYLGDSIE